jgi:hypothetical protein
MRPFLVRELQARAQSIPDEANAAMDFWVQHFGASAAGWLIWSQRRTFRRDGVVEFKIPASVKVPPWFRVAVETLARRQYWETSMVVNTASVRVYRVRWQKWRAYVPKPVFPALRVVK